MTTSDPDDALALDIFNFWFALKTAAQTGDWKQAQNILNDAPGYATPRHALITRVVGQAVLAGQAQIVAALTARGFVPDFDGLKDIGDKLEFVPPDHQHEVAAALRPLVRVALPDDCDKIVRLAWRQMEAPTVIAQLRAAGMDVLLGGEAAELVLLQERPALMQELLDQQMSPFAPVLVTAMLEDDASASEMRKVWWKHVCADPAAQAALERFDQMRAAGGPWMAAAFLNPLSCDNSGADVTLLGILAAHGRLEDVFDARYWRTTREDALKVHAALAAYGMERKVSLAPLIAALNREAVQARTPQQKRGKFKL